MVCIRKFLPFIEFNSSISLCNRRDVRLTGTRVFQTLLIFSWQFLHFRGRLHLIAALQTKTTVTKFNGIKMMMMMCECFCVCKFWWQLYGARLFCAIKQFVKYAIPFDTFSLLLVKLPNKWINNNLHLVFTLFCVYIEYLMKLHIHDRKFPRAFFAPVKGEEQTGAHRTFAYKHVMWAAIIITNCGQFVNLWHLQKKKKRLFKVYLWLYTAENISKSKFQFFPFISSDSKIFDCFNRKTITKQSLSLLFPTGFKHLARLNWFLLLLWLYKIRWCHFANNEIIMQKLKKKNLNIYVWEKCSMCDLFLSFRSIVYIIDNLSMRLKRFSDVILVFTPKRSIGFILIFFSLCC